MTEERKNQAREVRKRRQKQKKNKILPKLIVFVIFTGTLIVLSLTVFFKISEIKIIGVSKYTKSQIKEAANIEMDTSLLLLNKEETVRRIESKYSDIGEIKVKISLPDTVVIEDLGYQNLISIKDEKEVIIIDENKMVRRKLTSQIDKVLTVEGVKLKSAKLYSAAVFENENQYAYLAELLSSLKNNALSNITKITFKDSENIELIYQDRVNLKLGNITGLDEKIKKAKHILDTEVEKDAKGTLDLTVNDIAYFKENET